MTFIDGDTLADAYRKRLKLKEVEWDAFGVKELEWVEGVGDMNLGLLYHHVEFQLCPKLTFMKSDGENIVDNALENDPCIGSAAIPNKIYIYPNPFNEFFNNSLR